MGTQLGRAEAKWSTSSGKRREQTVEAFAGKVMFGVPREESSKVLLWQMHHLPHPTVLPDSFWTSTLPPDEAVT